MSVRLLTGAARLAGVMGWPVAHSLSPRLHGYWLAEHGIDGAYVPLAVRPERLAQALRALPALGFSGCNLTIPHKEAALAIVDEVAPEAGRIGAVNTVIVENDRLIGRNTDGYGFVASLPTALDLASGPAVVLGAGGAARAVVAALVDAGSPEVRLLNRTRERAQRLAAELGGQVRPTPWAPSALRGAVLLVNTTSLGMVHQPPLELVLDDLPADAVVTDIVYAPLETDLLARARARGNPVVDGLGMLLHQAVPGFEAWFGVRPEVTAEQRRVVLEALAG